MLVPPLPLVPAPTFFLTPPLLLLLLLLPVVPPPPVLSFPNLENTLDVPLLLPPPPLREGVADARRAELFLPLALLRLLLLLLLLESELFRFALFPAEPPVGLPPPLPLPLPLESFRPAPNPALPLPLPLPSFLRLPPPLCQSPVPHPSNHPWSAVKGILPPPPAPSTPPRIGAACPGRARLKDEADGGSYLRDQGVGVDATAEG